MTRLVDGVQKQGNRRENLDILLFFNDAVDVKDVKDVNKSSEEYIYYGEDI